MRRRHPFGACSNQEEPAFRINFPVPDHQKPRSVLLWTGREWKLK